ncbi:MAG TPA: 2'-5' RNA ligase family protein [Pseudonocardiaceae bacterium]
MANHWRWKRGWQPGRSSYAWHITFAGQQRVADLAAECAAALAGLPDLDIVPSRWLHLTMQKVGFTDEVCRDDLDAILAAVRERCAALRPVTCTLGPVLAFSEAVLLPVAPVEPLRAIRSEIRAAMEKVWPAERVPGDADDFLPHVSVAYSRGTGPAGPVIEAARHATSSAEVVVDTVTLIELNRDHEMWQWTDLAQVPLGAREVP